MKDKILKIIKFCTTLIFIYAELCFKLIIVIVLIHYLSVNLNNDPKTMYTIWITTLFGLMYILKSFVRDYYMFPKNKEE